MAIPYLTATASGALATPLTVTITFTKPAGVSAGTIPVSRVGVEADSVAATPFTVTDARPSVCGSGLLESAVAVPSARLHPEIENGCPAAIDGLLAPSTTPL